jgi:glucose/arabinose dehydrogenase
MQATIQERPHVHTVYTLTECDPSKAPREYAILEEFVRSYPLQEMPEHVMGWHRKRFAELRDAYHEKATVAVHEQVNLAPTVGRSVLAQRLAGTLTYTGTINYGAIGSSSTAPTNGDTQLGTEVYRQTTSSATYVNNIAYLSIFIAAGTATGTHYEGGLFIDGTGAANSGQLFSHVIFSPAITKSALNSLTLDVSITIT